MADTASTLTTEELASPSLCDEWDVSTVLAHVASTVATSRGDLYRTFILTSMSVHRCNTVLAHRMIDNHSPAQIVTLLRENSDREISRPLIGPRGPLTDALVHTGDICIPLGKPFAPPVEGVEVALDFLTGFAPGLVPRDRVAGLRLNPDDSSRTWGRGSELRGRASDVMMAVAGRPAALESLEGSGVRDLARRLRRAH